MRKLTEACGDSIDRKDEPSDPHVFSISWPTDKVWSDLAGITPDFFRLVYIYYQIYIYYTAQLQFIVYMYSVFTVIRIFTNNILCICYF